MSRETTHVVKRAVVVAVLGICLLSAASLLSGVAAAGETVDGFEDGDLSEYGGDTSAFDANSSAPVPEGSVSLKAVSDGSFNYTSSTSGLSRYPDQGETISYNMVLGEDGDSGNFYWFTQDETSSSTGYELFIRSGSNDDILLQRRDADNNVVGLASKSVDWQPYVGETLYIEVTPRLDGTHKAVVYDSSGSQVVSLVSDKDTTYTSGGIGFGARNFQSSSSIVTFDNVTITSEYTGDPHRNLELYKEDIMTTSGLREKAWVVRTGSSEYHAFIGNDDTSPSAVHHFTSTDGISWTDQGSVAGGTDNGAEDPAVFKDGDTWVMIAEDEKDRQAHVWTASSLDADSWTNGGPIKEPNGDRTGPANPVPWYDSSEGRWYIYAEYWNSTHQDKTTYFTTSNPTDNTSYTRGDIIIDTGYTPHSLYEYDGDRYLYVYNQSSEVYQSYKLTSDTSVSYIGEAPSDGRWSLTPLHGADGYSQYNPDGDNQPWVYGWHSSGNGGDDNVDLLRGSSASSSLSPGSVTFYGKDGTEITDRSTRVELYEASNDTVRNDARYWLDETNQEPIATGSGSSISLAKTKAGEEYVVAFRSEDDDTPQYRDVTFAILAGTSVSADWTFQLTGNMSVQQRVAIDDQTGGNWSSERVTIRAEQLSGGDTVSRTALGSANRGTLWLNETEAYTIYAERDDGAERRVGHLSAVASDSDSVAVFEILPPAEEFNATENVTGDVWSNESDVSYPPTARISADNRSPVVGDSITFDADSSTTYGETTISTYEWTLPDGSTATGSSVTWDSSGYDAGTTARAEVTITDSEGNTDSASLTLYVAGDQASAAIPPSADANLVTDDPMVGEPVALEEAASTADGVALESVEWDVDGDGTFESSGSSVEFTPEEAGLETVTIRVTDGNGVTAEREISFFVGSDANAGLGFGGGGGGGAGPIGGGDGPSGGQQLALGVAAAGGYALWRRSGGPGVVAVAQRSAPAVKQVAATAGSGVGALVRGTVRGLRGLVGALT